MVWTVPTLAAASVLAASLKPTEQTQRAVDDDGGNHDDDDGDHDDTRRMSTRTAEVVRRTAQNRTGGRAGRRRSPPAGPGPIIGGYVNKRQTGPRALPAPAAGRRTYHLSTPWSPANFDVLRPLPPTRHSPFPCGFGRQAVRFRAESKG